MPQARSGLSPAFSSNAIMWNQIGTAPPIVIDRPLTDEEKRYEILKRLAPILSALSETMPLSPPTGDAETPVDVPSLPVSAAGFPMIPGVPSPPLAYMRSPVESSQGAVDMPSTAPPLPEMSSVNANALGLGFSPTQARPGETIPPLIDFPAMSEWANRNILGPTSPSALADEARKRPAPPITPESIKDAKNQLNLLDAGQKFASKLKDYLGSSQQRVSQAAPPQGISQAAPQPEIQEPQYDTISRYRGLNMTPADETAGSAAADVIRSAQNWYSQNPFVVDPATGQRKKTTYEDLLDSNPDLAELHEAYPKEFNANAPFGKGTIETARTQTSKNLVLSDADMASLPPISPPLPGFERGGLMVGPRGDFVAGNRPIAPEQGASPFADLNQEGDQINEELAVLDNPQALRQAFMKDSTDYKTLLAGQRHIDTINAQMQLPPPEENASRQAQKDYANRFNNRAEAYIQSASRGDARTRREIETQIAFAKKQSPEAFIAQNIGSYKEERQRALDTQLSNLQKRADTRIGEATADVNKLNTYYQLQNDMNTLRKLNPNTFYSLIWDVTATGEQVPKLSSYEIKSPDFRTFNALYKLQDVATTGQYFDNDKKALVTTSSPEQSAKLILLILSDPDIQRGVPISDKALAIIKNPDNYDVSGKWNPLAPNKAVMNPKKFTELMSVLIGASGKEEQQNQADAESKVQSFYKRQSK